MQRAILFLLAMLAVLASCPAGAGGAVLRHRGVAVDAVFGEPPELAVRDVDIAAALGADRLRVSVQWSSLEPLHDGQYAEYYLQALDTLVARARAHGMRVVMTVVMTPCWASRGTPWVMDLFCDAPALRPGLMRLPPADPRQFGEVAVFLARRYADALAGLEVWNEPNLAGFWDTTAPAADYVTLLRATRTAMRAAGVRVPLVAGALAGAGGGFLDRLYALGIDGLYDALSVHVYNDGRPPDARLPLRFAGATFRQGLERLGATLRRHDERRPVWITELGWNTSTRRGELYLDGVDETHQALYLAEALRSLADPHDSVAVADTVLVYRLRDSGDDPAAPDDNFGLVHRDGSPKPALEAVRQAFAAGADP